MEVSPRHGGRPVLERAGFTGGVLPAACPSRLVLDHVTSNWGVLMLIALTQESLWGELRRVVQGISEKNAGADAQGRGGRRVRPAGGPAANCAAGDYSLTDRGRESAERLGPLLEWIDGHADEIGPSVPERLFEVPPRRGMGWHYGRGRS